MILPGAKLGVFGSGQLGRMFTQVASRMGYQVYAYSPESNSPAYRAGAIDFVASYEDENSLEKFLDTVDAVTFEFENIPEKTLQFIKEYQENRKKIPCHPSPDSLRIAQNRILEKNFFKQIGLPTVKYFPILDHSNVSVSIDQFIYPSILKTNRLGYDGKGQWKIQDPDELKNILSSIDQLDHVLEQRIEFDLELSVIAARFSSGKIFTYLPSENIHKNHILDTSIHPARVDQNIMKKSTEMARHLLESLDYVGVLGLEFFLKSGELYCNEFAPRPHNSGHFSMDFYPISQFELQLFALIEADLDLEKIEPNFVIMKNIIGPDFFDSKKIYHFINNPFYKLHLYQKDEAKIGRKMGHVNYNGKYNENLFPW
jgi:5-(carboxyamino)imidazole ribonucleotide synthase